MAKLFELPIVHSTINVANGQGSTLPGLAEELAEYPPIDRTAINPIAQRMTVKPEVAHAQVC